MAVVRSECDLSQAVAGIPMNMQRALAVIVNTLLSSAAQTIRVTARTATAEHVHESKCFSRQNGFAASAEFHAAELERRSCSKRGTASTSARWRKPLLGRDASSKL